MTAAVDPDILGLNLDVYTVFSFFLFVFRGLGSGCRFLIIYRGRGVSPSLVQTDEIHIRLQTCTNVHDIHLQTCTNVHNANLLSLTACLLIVRTKFSNDWYHR